MYQRDVTAGEAFQRASLQIPADSWRLGWVIRGHAYEFKVTAARGNYASGFSPARSVTANPTTADGPPSASIAVIPGAAWVDLSWTRPTGPYSDSVSGYKVFYVDNSVPGAVASTVSTSTPSVRLSGLVTGHVYGLAIVSTNAAGDGYPTGAPAAKAGMGRPAAPTLLSAYLGGCCDVALTWTSVNAAAGYWIWSHNVQAGNPLAQLPLQLSGTSYRVGWLVDGAENYEFCVQAANGTLRSPLSNCRRPVLPPGPADQTAQRYPSASDYAARLRDMVMSERLSRHYRAHPDAAGGP